MAEDAWERPDYRVLLVNQYQWRTSAGRVVENAMDFSHFNFVHVGYTELADGPIIKPYEIETIPRGIRYAYEDGRLRRDYTLEFPFIVHDRKNVINVGGGRTWSEGENTRVGDVTVSQLHRLAGRCRHHQDLRLHRTQSQPRRGR